MSKLKKYVEESKTSKSPDLEIIDRGVSNLTDAPGLCEYSLWVGQFAAETSSVDYLSASNVEPLAGE